jgi:predicted metalloprotease with PDZ domain
MKIGIVSLLVMAMNIASGGEPSVHYTLGMSSPSTHLLEVEVRFTGLPQDLTELELVLPVWRPGRYLVQDFAGGIEEVSAEDGAGKPLPWSKIEKSLWRISTRSQEEVAVRYRVFANEFNQRTRGLNDEHAFVDGSSVFMYAERYRSLPVRLTVRPCKDWHVTTGLEGGGEEFTAPNYDYFIDCPIEVGRQRDIAFSVEGVPHLLSIYGEGNYDADTLVRDISKIVSVEKAFWGAFPYKRYVFFLHCTPSSGGGTEHINSTVMGTRPFVFRNPESYRGFLGLVAHEYFHTWNVKQLRPRGIDPYDYTKENYTRELWIAEGTTSYYDALLLIPAGFMTPEKYLEAIAGAIRDDRERPGNAEQSVADASFDAWIKYWRGNEEAYNFETDYYGKGADVSLLLDLEIRQRSLNTHSLDDVLRALYARFPLNGGGYTLEDVVKVCGEMAGGSMREFFDKYVYGTAPLPWEEELSHAGLQLSPRGDTAKPWIGLATRDAGEKTSVTRVAAGSPAYRAGLDRGDEIVALNGFRVRSADLIERVAAAGTGTPLTITLFRDDRLREVTLHAEPNPVPDYVITKLATPTLLQRQVYEAWLRTPWASPK